MVGISTLLVITLAASCASAAPLRGHHESRPAGTPAAAASAPAAAVTAAASATVAAAAADVDASITAAALAASASAAAFASSQDAANTVFAENPDRPAFLGEVAFLQSKIQGELDAGENDAAAADEATLEAFDAPGFQ